MLSGRNTKEIRRIGSQAETPGGQGGGCQTEVFEYKTKTAVGLGRSVIQKLIGPRKPNNLLHHKVHVASFTTLRVKRSDAFLWFVMVARADCRRSPGNIGRWLPNGPAGSCRGCETGDVPTQVHILSKGRANHQLMTRLVNQLAAFIRRAILRNISEDLRSEYGEGRKDFSEARRDLRPGPARADLGSPDVLTSAAPGLPEGDGHQGLVQPI
jgi:hypothetical protein